MASSSGAMATLRLAVLAAAVLAAADSSVVGVGHRPAASHARLLGKLLPAADRPAAVRLIRHRYPLIPDIGCARVVAFILRPGQAPLLSRLGLKGVPALSLRLGFLQNFVSRLPPVFFDTSLVKSLRAFLLKRRILVSLSSLVGSLALTDVEVGGYKLKPVSTPVFSEFFWHRVLGITSKRRTCKFQKWCALPSYHVISKNLVGLPFASGFPGVFRSIALENPGVIVSTPIAQGASVTTAAIGIAQSGTIASHDSGKIVSTGTGKIISGGGSEVTLTGGSNVILSGGSETISTSGSKLISPSGAKIVSTGGHGIISTGGPTKTSTFGPKIISTAGTEIIPTGKSQIASTGGLELVSAGGSGIISTGAGKVVSASGGEVASATLVGGNVVLSGAVAASGNSSPAAVLKGLLAPGQIESGIKLVRGRYPGLPLPALASVIGYVVGTKNLPVFGKTKIAKVPGDVTGRLAFLESVFGSLPAVLYSGTHAISVKKHLQTNLNFDVTSSSQLVPLLALTDIYLAAQLLQPVSNAAFDKFFAYNILGTKGKLAAASRALPTLSQLSSKLSTIDFAKNPIFQPTGFAGAGLVPIFYGISLPIPSQPRAALGGLAAFLQAEGVPLSRFSLRLQVNKDVSIAAEISGVKTKGSLVRTDLLPLLGVRFSGFPKQLRLRLKFSHLASGYLRKVKIPSKLSVSYVTQFLGNFDKYVNTVVKSAGTLWLKGLTANTRD